VTESARALFSGAPYCFVGPHFFGWETREAKNAFSRRGLTTEMLRAPRSVRLLETVGFDERHARSPRFSADDRRVIPWRQQGVESGFALLERLKDRGD
jgi:hypothetical protein